MKEKNYDSIKCFWDDIQWFAFYCSLPSQRDVTKPKIKTTAKSVVKFVEDKLKMLNECCECFSHFSEHGENGFTFPCTTPHLLIWANAEGFEYWPAKCMSVDIDTRMVNVRYFGDHTYSAVNEGECYLISSVRPSSTHNLSDLVYTQAEEELKRYQNQVEAKFSFCAFWRPDTRFTVADFEEDQKSMITQDALDTDTESEHSIKSPKVTSPVSKKRRINEIDENFEAAIKEEEENAMKKNWQYIEKLKTALKNAHDEMDNMQQTHNNEKHTLETKLKTMEEENRKLTDQIQKLQLCASCGNPIKVWLKMFCGVECIQ